MIKILGALFLALTVGVSAAALSADLIIYASPLGGASGSGSEDNPVDLTTAIKKSEDADRSISIRLLPGRYSLSSPVIIKRSGMRRLIIEGYPRHRAIIDGAGRTSDAIIFSGRKLVIRGLVIENFRENGIVLSGARDVVINDNEVKDILSNRWSRGAIHGVHAIEGVLISDNVISRSGYSGIIFDSEEAGIIKDVKIRGNAITNSCLAVKDCGAVYVSGRSTRSGSIAIEKNTITHFGLSHNNVKAIYLDDGLSFATVTNNCIQGNGTYAFHIHGGGNITISRNQVFGSGMKSVLFYQSSKKYGRGMRKNRFFDNSVARSLLRRSAVVSYGDNAPTISAASNHEVRSTACS